MGIIPRGPMRREARLVAATDTLMRLMASRQPRAVAGFAERFGAIVANVEQVVRGKAEPIELSVLCMIAEGHLLIEDVPGVGKTSLAKAIASSIDCTWHRIQFTPDLLPSDVTGVSVYNRATGGFEFRPGGIFANIVLGDEINRASPKTQSALLEAMEEAQVTVDAHTYHLDQPFMVIATQNPIEHEGTYPLPDSQLDRFLMRIRMGYPDRTSEIEILDAHGTETLTAEELEPVASGADILKMIAVSQGVHVAPSLKGYIVDVAVASRRHPQLALGVSPRATIALQRAARARAAAAGQEYVVPDDIKAVAPAVLEHRLVLTPEAQLQGLTQTEVLESVLSTVAVPTSRG
jgi:MoxR-like ATPase